MKVIAGLCIVPLGVGTSVAEYVAACVRILEDAGLEIQLHAYGSNIGGAWDDVFAKIKRCPVSRLIYMLAHEGIETKACRTRSPGCKISWSRKQHDLYHFLLFSECLNSLFYELPFTLLTNLHNLV